MSQNSQPRWASLQAAAQYLGDCDVQTVRRMISRGDIRAVRLPGRSRLMRVDLNEIDAALKPVPTA